MKDIYFKTALLISYTKAFDLEVKDNSFEISQVHFSHFFSCSNEQFNLEIENNQYLWINSKALLLYAGSKIRHLLV